MNGNNTLAGRVMRVVDIISEYKKKYGDDDIIKYYNKNGSYAGIGEYLQTRMKEKEAEEKNKF